MAADQPPAPLDPGLAIGLDPVAVEEPRDVLGQGAGVGIKAVLGLGHRPTDDGPDGPGRVGPFQAAQVGPFVGLEAQSQGRQDGAQAVDVGGQGSRAAVADRGRREGQGVRFLGVGRGPAHLLGQGMVRFEASGEAPIDDVGGPVVGDHQVLEREVAVDEPLLVGVVDDPTGRQEDREPLPERAGLAGEVAKRLSLDVAHRIGGAIAAVGHQAEDGDDPRILERRSDLGLADEPATELVGIDERGVHHLVSHGPAELDVGGLEDDAHPSRPWIAEVLEPAGDAQGLGRRPDDPRRPGPGAEEILAIGLVVLAEQFEDLGSERVVDAAFPVEEPGAIRRVQFARRREDPGDLLRSIAVHVRALPRACDGARLGPAEGRCGPSAPRRRAGRRSPRPGSRR